MLNVVRNGENRIDLELSGKIDSEAMRIGLDELFTQSEGIEHGTMLYRIKEFDLPTLGAIGVEFKKLPELFKLIGRFDKAAVLADQSWLRVASKVEGALIPGLEIKAFELDEEAEAWLAE